MSMKSNGLLIALVVTAAGTAGCATTSFVSTWKNPAAAPLKPEGKKVAAVVVTKNEANRRSAEDALAQAISKQGAQGVPLYSVTSSTDENAVKAALEKDGFAGIVTMRPVAKDKELTVTSSMYAAPYYGGYWGGYYGYGWGAPYGGTDVRTDTIITIETLVYSLKQNKLVWAGQSQTTNPSKVDGFVQEVATAAAAEMKKAGLIGTP
jgi:hypothetical protein